MQCPFLALHRRVACKTTARSQRCSTRTAPINFSAHRSSPSLSLSTRAQVGLKQPTSTARKSVLECSGVVTSAPLTISLAAAPLFVLGDKVAAPTSKAKSRRHRASTEPFATAIECSSGAFSVIVANVPAHLAPETTETHPPFRRRPDAFEAVWKLCGRLDQVRVRQASTEAP
ncbi:hypothetical protein PHLGIDRAFT_421534 [Phlebiopsis gigantea 11061_1 CR5-6]|uniref:Uncharacterized protein n=1 Tax=Phlebiopsis gigantea (strain 11061_1 CR5-6) TaxID=745531 RepID=A0A0C3RYY9_PHLG1|nr:hypothetical protein PHLGIDRAFT_421534 [Phlebiopsis gigantea 11061_1 CR5-6]